MHTDVLHLHYAAVEPKDWCLGTASGSFSEKSKIVFHGRIGSKVLECLEIRFDGVYCGSCVECKVYVHAYLAAYK